MLMALICYTAFRLVRGFRRSTEPRLRLFLGCAAVSFLVAGLAGMLDIFDIDATVLVLYWALLGMILGATGTLAKGGTEDE